MTNINLQKAVFVAGASSGIGRSTAILFAEKGYFVFLLGRNSERLQETQSLCCNPLLCQIIPCDMTNTQDVQNAIKRIEVSCVEKSLKLEVLIHSAGIFQTHTFMEGTDDLWLEQFSTNLLGPVRFTKGLLHLLESGGGGAIINVSSTLGMRPTSSTGAYSAIKAAMNNWTQSLAIELGPKKIRVNCVCPGIVDTPMHGFHSLKGSSKTQQLQQLGPLQPLMRIGNPDEVAQAILFLSSEVSSWTTGAVLAVDGGINLGTI